MNELFVLTVIGDLELNRRMLLQQLDEAHARIRELEAQLAEAGGSRLDADT